LQKFLGEMIVLARTRLNSYSRERRFLPQQVVEIPPTKPAASPPAGMVRIPAGELDPYAFNRKQKYFKKSQVKPPQVVG
jgi:hypothetical protein